MQQADTETGNESEVESGEQAEQQETTQGEPSEQVDSGEGGEQGADEEVVVTIGEESPPQEDAPAPEWVRELRQKHRETTRRVRELEEENAKLKAPAQPDTLGAKPTLASCEYDEAAFEQALDEWNTRKREADAREKQKTEAAEAEKKAWAAKLEAFKAAKAELKVKDYDEAEAAAQEIFSTIQQGVILNGADNPALLVYALGKNPAKAKELAAKTDPVKFAFAVAKLESQLKVSPRKAAPPPEEKVQGSAPVSGVVDSQLERLRAEADRTGDRSKVAKYMREQAAKKRA